ncbi:MAG: DUF4872 domain-containing protein [Anaerolineales bacterium]|nr:DUF4872 domain-containing protein [Anaerolineales bacterium]
MELRPFDGFRSFKTHHCVTGSMIHIYHFYDHPLSEDMLFGIGSGLGFFYWHQKGMAPMFAGRGNVHRPGVEGLEITTGRRTGVKVERHHTSSRKKAEKALFEALEEGRPFMIHVDMGYLPYFDLPEDYHFGGHVVVVCGWDPEGQNVLLADRDERLHLVSLEDLAAARGSTYKPFPPYNTWYNFDFSGKRMPEQEDVWKAIGEVCETMLEGPISNIGVRGIRKAAKRALKWPTTMDAEELRWTCFNNYIFIDAEGGTGGGIFRYMYARFLEESAKITQKAGLIEIGAELRTVGDTWQMVAELFKRGSEMEDPASLIPETTEPLMEIADLEEGIWTRLREMVDQR